MLYQRPCLFIYVCMAGYQLVSLLLGTPKIINLKTLTQYYRVLFEFIWTFFDTQRSTVSHCQIFMCVANSEKRQTFMQTYRYFD